MGYTALPACRRGNSMESDAQTKIALEEHWRASERGYIEAEHAIYSADAILDYPNQVNDSRAAQRSRRNGAGTLPVGT
jgi:hypothetical protein